MPKWIRSLCILCVLWMSVACGTPQSFSGQTDGYTATLTLAQPPRTNIAQTATVRITKDSQNVNASNVACDLQMTGMTMGSNRPLAEQNADGTYRCDLLFTMSGEWSVVIHGSIDAQPIKISIPNIIVSE